jgi:OOP family OmpA-OmpF porin
MRNFMMTLLLFSQVMSWAVDKDNDGVKDTIDQCPNTAQLKMVSPDFRYAMTVNQERVGKKQKAWPVLANGCEPDDDHDGVKNSADFCPNDTKLAVSKGVAANGCPIHSDKDGTPDYRDDCPNTPYGIKTNNRGCPVLGAESQSPIKGYGQRLKKLFKKKTN